MNFPSLSLVPQQGASCMGVGVGGRGGRGGMCYCIWVGEGGTAGRYQEEEEKAREAEATGRPEGGGG